MAARGDLMEVCLTWQQVMVTPEQGQHYKVREERGQEIVRILT